MVAIVATDGTEAREALRVLEPDRPADLEHAGGNQQNPGHRLISFGIDEAVPIRFVAKRSGWRPRIGQFGTGRRAFKPEAWAA